GRKKLNRGMLSYHRMAAPQCGQREPGRSSDSCRGNREMQTLAKLPTIKPRTPMARSISGRIGVQILEDAPGFDEVGAERFAPRPQVMTQDGREPGAVQRRIRGAAGHRRVVCGRYGFDGPLGVRAG